MKINTKLKTAAFAPLLMAAIVAVASWMEYREIKTSQQRSRAAEYIIQSMNDLHSLAATYLLHHEERPRQQFIAQHEATAQLLARSRFSDPEQQHLIDSLSENTHAIAEIFRRMVEIHLEHPLTNGSAATTGDENRLAGQLLVRSRQGVADALRLETLVKQQIADTQSMLNSFIVAMMLVVTIPLTLFLVFMTSGIARSMTKLHRGAAALGSGNLSYRINLIGEDELAELAGTLDRMADNLQTVTVSKNELQREVDERRVAEAALRKSEAELRNVQNSLREDDRRKDEFLAMLGHELRNPLGAITAGLRLLRSQNPDQHEWVRQSLERQTKQLVGLVDDLLDISRIKSGKIQMRSTTVDLRAIAADAAESVRDLMAEKKHAFTMHLPEAPIWILGDPTRLNQIVGNLLINAAKYTNSGGTIELVLSRVENQALVSVKDNGMGIPAGMQESIFQLFGQVDSEMHKPQQGLGIGLSLVKMLTERQNGSVSVKSEGIGHGSEFTVRFPIVEIPENVPDSAESADKPAEEAFDFLLVEDNPESARMLGAVLQERGHTVRLADNGKEAIALAAARQPQVIILDIGLPDITGYQVSEAIRKELGYSGTLIIAATGYGQDQDRQKSREAGIDHHLVKPVEYETIALLAREWRRTVRSDRSINGTQIAADKRSTDVKRTKILIIDDSAVIARMTQRVLQEQGHEAEVAFDGSSGIEAAKRFRPELVLCDLNLPGLDGFEVLKALRSDADLGPVVVAAMTGFDEEHQKDLTRSAGFDAHLVKPVSTEQLAGLIGRTHTNAGILNPGIR